MEESIYIRRIREAFSTSFPDGWINDYNWSNKKKHKDYYFDGTKKINDLNVLLFINLAKLVLSAEFFFTDIEKQLESLDSLVAVDLVADEYKAKKSLIGCYEQMADDFHESILLVSYFIRCSKRRYEQKHLDNLFSAIQYKDNRDKRGKLVELLHCIIETCQLEYDLKYNLGLINHILLLREALCNFNFSQEINDIRDATVDKLEFMLFKISFFSKNKKIQYNYNLQHVNLNPLANASQGLIDMKQLFEDYLDVDSWGRDKIHKYSIDFKAESVELWRAVLLMRYYTKKSKNIKQIDHLIEIQNRHYEESLDKDKDNIVNLYADKTSHNYFYNSRFSFLCKSWKTYKYENMKNDLTEIEQIQNETFVFNYHPYQKAIVYLINLINFELSSNKKQEEIKEHYDYLEYCFKKFKETVQWCEINQPYILQLRFNFSTINDEKRNLKVFYPSSFLRPLRFDHLNDDIQEYKSQISLLKYSVESLPQRQQLFKAQEKIESVEKDSYKRMSYFSTIIIFLVGLITIFTGNSSNISIFNKVQYVIVLGTILLLFVCFGYLALAKINGHLKHWLFGFFTGCLLCYLGCYYVSQNPATQKGPNKIEAQGSYNDSLKTRSVTIQSCGSKTRNKSNNK